MVATNKMEVQRAILGLLHQNGAMKLNAVASKLNYNPRRLQDELNNLMAEGKVSKYRANGHDYWSTTIEQDIRQQMVRRQWRINSLNLTL